MTRINGLQHAGSKKNKDQLSGTMFHICSNGVRNKCNNNATIGDERYVSDPK